MVYNPDIHHRRSIRLKGYDYSKAGAYYVTVCVQNRECLFGEIINGNMRLNDNGKMILSLWHQITNKFPHIQLDHFIIMPNHLHGIIIINGFCDNTRRGEVTSPLQPPLQNSSNIITLGKIIAYFKYQSTKNINQMRKTPGIKLWQRSYYDHIIRNESELNRIRKYIGENPVKWDLDKNNPDNLKAD